MKKDNDFGIVFYILAGLTVSIILALFVILSYAAIKANLLAGIIVSILLALALLLSAIYVYVYHRNS